MCTCFKPVHLGFLLLQVCMCVRTHAHVLVYCLLKSDIIFRIISQNKTNLKYPLPPLIPNGQSPPPPPPPPIYTTFVETHLSAMPSIWNHHCQLKYTDHSVCKISGWVQSATEQEAPQLAASRGHLIFDLLGFISERCRSWWTRTPLFPYPLSSTRLWPAFIAPPFLACVCVCVWGGGGGGGGACVRVCVRVCVHLLHSYTWTLVNFFFLSYIHLYCWKHFHFNVLYVCYTTLVQRLEPQGRCFTNFQYY